ncbi:hypothetical protein SLS57_010547 [Botryosphaeria dothidea]
MNEPVYEDDLTMLHPRHGTALLLLQQHAVAAKAAIDAAESEGTLNTALGNMTRVATAARTMFAGAEIKKPDMPFGEVGLETSLRDGCEDKKTNESDDEDEEEESIPTSSESSSSDFSSSDGENDSDGDNFEDLMDLDEKSATAVADLRRVNSLHYDIHLHRIRRLILRLPRPLSNCPSPPFDSSTDHPLLYNEAGVPLPQKTTIECAELIIDELALTAEYRKAMLEVLVKQVAEG